MRLNRREISLLPLAATIVGSNALGAEARPERRFNRPQATVDYRPLPRDKAQCGNCKLFRSATNNQSQGCVVVAGPIVPNGSCVLHEFA
jgi:hypothetical protein